MVFFDTGHLAFEVQTAEIGEEFARFLPLANCGFRLNPAQECGVELLPKGFETAAQRDDEDVNSLNVIACPAGQRRGVNTFKASDARA